MLKRRIAIKKFNKRINPSHSIPASKIILTTPAIFNVLANCIINFRIINWQFLFADQKSTREFCIKIYLLEIKSFSIKSGFPEDKINKILSLSDQILNRELQDVAENSSWASAGIVNIMRNFKRRDLYNGQIIRLRIRDARERFLNIYAHYKNHDKKVCALIEREYTGDSSYDEIFIGIQKNNLCHVLREGLIHSILILLIPLTLFYLMAKTFDIDSLSPRTNNLIHLLPLAFVASTIFMIAKERLFRCNLYFSKNLFSINDLSGELRGALLESIAENMQKIIKNRIPKQEIPENNNISRHKPVSYLQGEEFEQESILEIKNNKPFSHQDVKLKTKTRDSFPDLLGRHCEEIEDHQNQFYTNLILNSARLAASLEIIWKAEGYGLIRFKWGNADTYKLWSSKPNLEVELKLCFAHFPTEKLLAGNDSDLIQTFKKIASLGHVVDYEAQGYVRTSEKTFKIKLFAKKYKKYRMPVELSDAKLIKSPPGYEFCRLFIAKNPIEKSDKNQKSLQALYF